jgi:predicted dehydrogenase
MDQHESTKSIDRRDFLKAAGAAGLTVNLFKGPLRGANDRITLAFIGTGAQGISNLRNALAAREQAQVVVVCDVYQPAVEKANALVRFQYGSDPKNVRDFREILADKSIDAVCISTPDHWHALMTVEACKAGKDVYIEKPAFVHLDEGPKMVEAARKYNRVVQGGTMQRSMPTFLKAKEIVESGVLGSITWCKTWACSLSKQEGFGRPADGDPPAGLDWDMWLGPAPKVPFNENRWGVTKATFPTFRYFWDYAGGAMTDWGVHFIDPIHQCLGEPMPHSITALGGRFWVKDNLETADTMTAVFQYPNFMMTYELRQSCATPMFGQGGATGIMGTEGMVVVTRSGCWLNPNKDSKVEPIEFLTRRSGGGGRGATSGQGGVGVQTQGQPQQQRTAAPEQGQPSDHWKNFLDCIKTRQKPISDIENMVRSSAVCILGNVSMRAKTCLDFDERTFSVRQPEAGPFIRYNYRAPWKLQV